MHSAHAHGSDFSAQRALRFLPDVVMSRCSNYASHGSASPTKLLLVESGKIYRISCADWPSLLSHVFRGVYPFDKFSGINLRPFLSPRHYFDRLQLATPSSLNPFSPSTQILLHRSDFSSIATCFHLLINTIGYFRLGRKGHTTCISRQPTNFSTSLSYPKVVQWKETHR